MSHTSQEVLVGGVYESEGFWYTSWGVGGGSLLTGPALHSEEMAEDYLSNVINEVRLQSDERGIVFERLSY